MLVVITPATTTRLLTLASVKEDLDVTGAANDTQITRFIDEATKTLARRSDRDVWGSERVEETWRLDGCLSSLILTRRPVSTIHSVTVDGDALSVADFELDGRLLYRLDGSDSRMAWSGLKTVVNYTAGYALEAAAPADLAAACRTLVALKWFASDRDPALKAEEVPGVLRQDYWVGDVPSDDPDGLPAGIASLCWHYRFV